MLIVVVVTAVMVLAVFMAAVLVNVTVMAVAVVELAVVMAVVVVALAVVVVAQLVSWEPWVLARIQSSLAVTLEYTSGNSLSHSTNQLLIPTKVK